MNKVISIDEKNYCMSNLDLLFRQFENENTYVCFLLLTACLLEPGITYIDLYEELKRRGVGDEIWIDVPDLGGGSVMGSTCLIY